MKNNVQNYICRILNHSLASLKERYVYLIYLTKLVTNSDAFLFLIDECLAYTEYKSSWENLFYFRNSGYRSFF